jgi:hypothetical protein
MIPTWFDRIDGHDRSEIQHDRSQWRMECRTWATYDRDLGTTLTKTWVKMRLKVLELSAMI